jgi:hypothetical protein
MTMNIANDHARDYPGAAARLPALLDAFADPARTIWPSPPWPALRLDRGLAVGSRGGHGPIRYAVCEYEPGRRVRFAFDPALGFVGWHELVVDGASLAHRMRFAARGVALAKWALVIRPLHDALIEDLFDRAAAALGQSPVQAPWTWRVRFGRALLARAA